ncbi:hypothetical protein QSJ18_16350 [Gordonia sp. ABSL1-1]|uniref:hypothetical protein n=1 Tax=Gordonia sp. ABSL1-1 TaxID=3053923 RepID=UPI0025742870|nr:hypothetical protein [Gordonia sp. ABSL1-1]MDL9938324.1 hypothetical protein [Gordonia sp. ABSL1-1]
MDESWSVTTRTADVAIDVAQVSEVVAFYRRTALVVTAAADDLASHDFGRWGSDDPAPDTELAGAEGVDPVEVRIDEYAAQRYSSLCSGLVSRLHAHAAAADDLATALHVTAGHLADADLEAATLLTAEISRWQADRW